ncbi:MAG: hypothetical protein WBB73_11820, partial [Candidatus Aminicenantaceae bacterium]
PSIFQIDLLPTNPIEFPSAAMLAVQSIPHLTPTPADPSLLFIINFTDFMCPACLDSLLLLCRLLPRHIQQTRVWGIVVLSHDSGESRADSPDEKSAYSRSIKIMEKKIRGFQKANNISFPLLLDYDHIFRSLAGEGTSVLLFSPLQGSILKLTFPISKADTERLLKLWLPEMYIP